MYIGFSKKLKALGGLRIGVGKRMSGAGGLIFLIGIGIVYIYWYMFLACLWLIFGCCWLLCLPVNAIVKAVKKKQTAKRNSGIE